MKILSMLLVALATLATFTACDSGYEGYKQQAPSSRPLAK